MRSPPHLGKALAPCEVIFVGDIPKTRNVKVMRRIVRAAYLGEKLGDTLRWKTRRRWMKSSGRQRTALDLLIRRAGF